MEAMKIPAIRGKIGDTVFYTANLSFGQISSMVKRVDGELHTAKSIKEEIQRSLSDNYKKISEYILKREDRFFDSLVLAVYDGSPEWREIRYEIEGVEYPNVGLLEFSGDEKIFPVDGQHRVEGIKHAISINSSLEMEMVNVMLIGHSNTPQGMEKSRRIFSTLNRYVKPVRLGDIIALDEDDVVAIVTRDLLESYPLFLDDRIVVSNSKSIPVTNKKAFTTLMTLYECHKALLCSFLSEKDDKERKGEYIVNYLKYRPTDNVIVEFEDYLKEFWNCMKDTFREIQDFELNEGLDAASELRSVENGGNLFFRPAGLLPFVDVVAKLSFQKHLSCREIVNGFSMLDRQISGNIWNHILWDDIKKQMIMKNQTLQKYILRYLYDRTNLSEKEKDDMISKYALILNVGKEEAAIAIDEFTL